MPHSKDCVEVYAKGMRIRPQGSACNSHFHNAIPDFNALVGIE